MKQSIKQRSRSQKIKDAIFFPFRVLLLVDRDRWGFTSLKSERFDYCAREVQGYCLDVGCGRHNLFIREYLGGNGKGIDSFPYEGLGPDELVDDLTHFSFPDDTFDSISFIANLSHIPESSRETELAEAYRVLKPGGNIIISMGEPLTEVFAHKQVQLYDRFLGTNYDVDTIRGMHEEEAYYLTRKEIMDRLTQAGFGNIRKKRFWTQWGLNAVYVAWKLETRN